MKMTKKRIVYTAIVTLIVVFSSTFAILMTLERTDYRNYLQAEYTKNMYELISSVQNIRTNLSKSAVVGSREQSIIVFEEIFRHASMANDKLHSLPIPQETLDNSSKFLSQVGDFCYTLGRNASEGKELKEKDYQTIDNLKNRSFQLEVSLKKTSDEISEGKVKWGEIRKRVSGVFAKNRKEALAEKFKGIQKQVAQYPALIYDGPFSDNIVDIAPKINSKDIVSQKEAENIAKKTIGADKVESIKINDRQSNTKIPTYSFEVYVKGRNDKKSTIACEVSKHGGKIVYLLDNKAIGKININKDKAMQKGMSYLNTIGYKNMIPMYTMNYGSTMVISYVYKQDNIIIYPDQIKLKIALDDGSIVGIESEKYLISHVDKRQIDKPKITAEQAKDRVSKRLKINSIRLAIVPTETNKEVLCYEFSGVCNDEDFIVYINANTGFEQRIIQIINTPNGELTI